MNGVKLAIPSDCELLRLEKIEKVVNWLKLAIPNAKIQNFSLTLIPTLCNPHKDCPYYECYRNPCKTTI